MKKRLAVVLAGSLITAQAHAIEIEKMSGKRYSVSGAASEVEYEVVGGQALVRFNPGVSTADRDSALATMGASFGRILGDTGWSLVTLPAGLPVATGLSRLRGLSAVAEAAPNHAYRFNRLPNDPLYSTQYHLDKINAPSAWEYEVGSSSRVTVAVVDAGVENTHPDLSAKMAGLTHQFCDPGANKSSSGGNTACVADGTPGTPACNHGTRVAGVAAGAGNNGNQITGVSWDAQILSLKVFRDGDCSSDCSGLGCATDDQAIIDSINHARTLHNSPATGKIVMNMSIGGAQSCPTAVQTAITNAFNEGLVLVVSAGNDGSSVNSPANCNNVIPVGATDINDNVASFSSNGTELANNGVVAPGVSLTTTDLSGGVTGAATGTSFSAPIVSGLAALIIAQNPALAVGGTTNIRDRIRSGAVSIGVSSLGSQPLGNSTGAGRVNAFRTMKLVVDGTLSGFTGDAKVIAFPNPFRPASHGAATITIPTSLQSTGTSVKVYTISGQLVKDLGTTTSWNGTNEGGNQVATGTYIVLVKTDAGVQRTRLAVIR